MTREHRKKQRLFNTALPANCRECGVLVCIAPSRNGIQCKFDLDDNSNPTLTPHICAVATAKRLAREQILGENSFA